MSSRLASLGRACAGWRTVLLAWITARLLTLGSFAAARLVDGQRPAGSHFEGLLGWDAAWYGRIAALGYAQTDVEARRFFPVFPMLASGVSDASGLPEGISLLLISNTSALVLGLLLYRLVILEGWNDVLARGAVWACYLAPSGFVYVMGYSESLTGAVLVGVALLVRSGRWLPVLPLCVVAGALRPNGFAIAALVAVEACRDWRHASRRQRVLRVVAVAGAPLGLALFLAWQEVAFGEALAPLRIAAQPGLRGGRLVNPLVTGDVGSILGHLFWVGLSAGLIIVCARRMPASYTWFTLLAFLLAVNSRGFLSFERVVSVAFPLAMVVSLVLPQRRRRVVALAAGGALCGYTMLAALTLYVP